MMKVVQIIKWAIVLIWHLKANWWPLKVTVFGEDEPGSDKGITRQMLTVVPTVVYRNGTGANPTGRGDCTAVTVQ